VTETELAAQAGVEGYYVRLGEPRVRVEFPGRASRTRAEEDVSNVSPDALALVRFGLRSPHDPRMVNTVKVIDRVLQVDTGAGPGWRRYLGDCYGEDEAGTPHPGGRRGIGRAWPLFIGERGHFELAAGRRDEAERLLRLMEKTAGPTGLIPEQTWDAPDIPKKGLFRGGPTTSASPLVWAHAEYTKLLRSLWDNAVFDLPPQPVERYCRANDPPRLRVWRLNHRIEQVPAGHGLRIELPEAAAVRWSAPGHQREDVPTTDTGLGVHHVDLPTQGLPPGATVEFSFHWTKADRRDRGDYAVKVVDE
jgi:glucoamylase